MDENLIIVLRMLERLLVVGFGGMAIYFGYKLFFHLPHQADHKGKLDLLGMKIVLSRVAPGIFFLAFGAVILLHNLNSGITQTVNNTSVTGEGREQSQTFSGASDLSTSTNDKGLVPRRNAVIEQLGELNCLMKIAEEKNEIPASINIAHHDAKIALLKPVWNAAAWGSIDTLSSDSDAIANESLKGVFTDVSVVCKF
jgi:hypothetical protein